MEHDLMRELTASYALDALDPEDEQLMVEHLRGCSACRGALADFRETTGALAAAADPAGPPKALRARILDTVARERADDARPAERPWAFRLVASGAALAGAAAIALAVWNVSLVHRLDNEGAAGAEVVRVWGGDGSLIVSRNGKAFLLMRNLEPAPDGRTYEAWVVTGGIPHPAGTFSGGSKQAMLALERLVPRGASVAVTVEPAGGSETPTTTPIFRTTRA